jgi:hypothetical protein
MTLAISENETLALAKYKGKFFEVGKMGPRHHIMRKTNLK